MSHYSHQATFVAVKTIFAIDRAKVYRVSDFAIQTDTRTVEGDFIGGGVAHGQVRFKDSFTMNSQDDVPVPSEGIIMDEHGNWHHAEIQVKTVAEFVGQIHETKKLEGEELQEARELIRKVWQ